MQSYPCHAVIVPLYWHAMKHNYPAIFLFLLGLFSSPLLHAQNTQFKGFGNVNYHFMSDSANKVHNNFELGEFDLFVTSQINEKVSFLSEVVISNYRPGNLLPTWSA